MSYEALTRPKKVEKFEGNRLLTASGRVKASQLVSGVEQSSSATLDNELR